MSFTPTLPPNDKRMWRKIAALAHPDNGGSNELFTWVVNTMDWICDPTPATGASTRERRAKPSTPAADCVPFHWDADFGSLTRRALELADDAPTVYGRLLRLLADCYSDPSFDREQARGAGYKRLAAIGHAAGMTKAERTSWYRLCESIPLADRHAGHILGRLHGGDAA